MDRTQETGKGLLKNKYSGTERVRNPKFLKGKRCSPTVPPIKLKDENVPQEAKAVPTNCTAHRVIGIRNGGSARVRNNNNNMLVQQEYNPMSPAKQEKAVNGRAVNGQRVN